MINKDNEELGREISRQAFAILINSDSFRAALNFMPERTI